MWVCESTHSTVNFMNSKSRARISDDNLVLVLRCALNVKYTLKPEKMNVQDLINTFAY